MTYAEDKLWQQSEILRISITTVSRVLNHDESLNVQDETKRRVFEVAVKRGHQRIAFIGSDERNEAGEVVMDLRERIYRDVMKNHGLLCEEYSELAPCNPKYGYLLIKNDCS